MIANLTIDLPPSRTKKRRYYQLTAPAAEWMCQVMIVNGRETDVYFVDTFEDQDLKPGLRSVYFSRQTGKADDPDRPPLYRVILDPHGVPLHCDCKASVCRLQTPVDGAVRPDEFPADRAMTCKHKDVALSMAAHGLFPPTEVAADAPAR